MKVKVKLYGTLSLKVPEYKPSQGIEVEMPDGATVRDLLTHLEILETRGAAVVANGRVLKADDKMQDGSSLDVFQSIQGG
ncbi:MAG: MoaD/ThiS family protein [Anaerolineales bacterium]|nr:MoaD/ThiS family protein [Anaerolineales bacterium]